MTVTQMLIEAAGATIDEVREEHIEPITAIIKYFHKNYDLDAGYELYLEGAKEAMDGSEELLEDFAEMAETVDWTIAQNLRNSSYTPTPDKIKWALKKLGAEL